MEHHNITIGNATYQVGRIFQGQCPASNLILDRLTRTAEAKPVFDPAPRHGV